MVLVAGVVTIQPLVPQTFPVARPSILALPHCPAQDSVSAPLSPGTTKPVSPPVGRDPASILHSPVPWRRYGHPGPPPVREDVCPGWSVSPKSHEATPRGGSRRSSGIVAAAGVVNQADEQRILLPGYFTTPGLHHTHPLQASLVGPWDPAGADLGVGRRWRVCGKDCSS